MARPNGSRKVRGWMMTPKVAAAAGVSLTKELTKEDMDKLVKAKMSQKSTDGNKKTAQRGQNPMVSADDIKSEERQAIVTAKAYNNALKTKNKNWINENKARYDALSKKQKEVLRILPSDYLKSASKAFAADKRLEREYNYFAVSGNKLTASQIRRRAITPPTEIVSYFSNQRAKEFEKNAEKSGFYWKDKRTGASFNLSDAEKRMLQEVDNARKVIGLPPLDLPGKWSQLNESAAVPKKANRPPKVSAQTVQKYDQSAKARYKANSVETIESLRKAGWSESELKGLSGYKDATKKQGRP